MSNIYVGLFIVLTIILSNFRVGHAQRFFNVIDHGACGDGHKDDSEAFLKAWNASCSSEGLGIPTVLIPAGKTFLLQPTVFSGYSCNSNNGIQVEILGNIVAPKNPDEWKTCVESWLCFGNVNNLVVKGTGEINGQGSLWWSNATQPNNVSKLECSPPKALHFHTCDNLELSGVTSLDSPKSHISITHSNNLTISDLHIRAPRDSPNTDGIDISVSTNVRIHNLVIATGDDCIAINNGSSFINITNIACGPGHGISVGSLGVNGSYQTAEEIHIRNCSFNGTQNGARIKTWQGGSGYAKKISFEHIILTAVKRPIIIDQSYSCQECTSSAVTVSDVSYSYIQGTSANEEAIVFNCTQTPGCTNIVMKQVNITSADPSQNISAFCSNANGTYSTTVPEVPCLTEINGTSFNLYT